MGGNEEIAVTTGDNSRTRQEQPAAPYDPTRNAIRTDANPRTDLLPPTELQKQQTYASFNFAAETIFGLVSPAAAAGFIPLKNNFNGWLDRYNKDPVAAMKELPTLTPTIEPGMLESIWNSLGDVLGEIGSAAAWVGSTAWEWLGTPNLVNFIYYGVVKGDWEKAKEYALGAILELGMIALTVGSFGAGGIAGKLLLKTAEKAVIEKGVTALAEKGGEKFVASLIEKGVIARGESVAVASGEKFTANVASSSLGTEIRGLYSAEVAGTRGAEQTALRAATEKIEAQATTLAEEQFNQFYAKEGLSQIAKENAEVVLKQMTDPKEFKKYLEQLVREGTLTKSESRQLSKFAARLADGKITGAEREALIDTITNGFYNKLRDEALETYTKAFMKPFKEYLKKVGEEELAKAGKLADKEAISRVANLTRELESSAERGFERGFENASRAHIRKGVEEAVDEYKKDKDWNHHSSTKKQKATRFTNDNADEDGGELSFALNKNVKANTDSQRVNLAATNDLYEQLEEILRRTKTFAKDLAPTGMDRGVARFVGSTVAVAALGGGGAGAVAGTQQLIASAKFDRANQRLEEEEQARRNRQANMPTADLSEAQRTASQNKVTV
jgi:hypothetical protein